MSANDTSMPNGFNPILYCAAPIQFVDLGCPGLCSNPDIKGLGALISFFVTVLVSGMAMIWLPNPANRRLQYYMQYLHTFTRLASGTYFYYVNQINTFDAYLTVWLVAGANMNAIIGGAAGMNIVDFPLTLAQPVLCGIAILFLIGTTVRAHHGSQPACQYDFALPLLIPLFIISGVMFILVLVSGTKKFNKLFIRYVGSFGRTVDSYERAELYLRIFWTVLLCCGDAYWIVAILMFLHSYDTPGKFLNPDQYHVTQSTILSMGLAVIIILPTIKNILEQITERFGVNPGRKQRGKHQDILTSLTNIVSNTIMAHNYRPLPR